MHRNLCQSVSWFLTPDNDHELNKFRCFYIAAAESGELPVIQAIHWVRQYLELIDNKTRMKAFMLAVKNNQLLMADYLLSVIDINTINILELETPNHLPASLSTDCLCHALLNSANDQPQAMEETRIFSVNSDQQHRKTNKINILELFRRKYHELYNRVFQTLFMDFPWIAGLTETEHAYYQYLSVTVRENSKSKADNSTDLMNYVITNQPDRLLWSAYAVQEAQFKTLWQLVRKMKTNNDCDLVVLLIWIVKRNHIPNEKLAHYLNHIQNKDIQAVVEALFIRLFKDKINSFSDLSPEYTYTILKSLNEFLLIPAVQARCNGIKLIPIIENAWKECIQRIKPNLNNSYTRDCVGHFEKDIDSIISRLHQNANLFLFIRYLMQFGANSELYFPRELVCLIIHLSHDPEITPKLNQPVREWNRFFQPVNTLAVVNDTMRRENFRKM